MLLSFRANFALDSSQTQEEGRLCAMTASRPQKKTLTYEERL